MNIEDCLVPVWFFFFLSIVKVQFLKYLVTIIVVTILNNLQISSIFVVFEIYSDKAKLTLYFTQA